MEPKFRWGEEEISLPKECKWPANFPPEIFMGLYNSRAFAELTEITEDGRKRKGPSDSAFFSTGSLVLLYYSLVSSFGFYSLPVVSKSIRSRLYG